MSHKEELEKRSSELQTEIQELNRTFELKKEEFLNFHQSTHHNHV